MVFDSNDQSIISSLLLLSWGVKLKNQIGPWQCKNFGCFGETEVDIVNNLSNSIISFTLWTDWCIHSSSPLLLFSSSPGRGHKKSTSYLRATARCPSLPSVVGAVILALGVQQALPIVRLVGLLGVGVHQHLDLARAQEATLAALKDQEILLVHNQTLADIWENSKSL